ncbi:hypothetical protein N9059_01995, partial [bacterium]|nr:hypothetical protein [bacterium]
SLSISPLSSTSNCGTTVASKVNTSTTAIKKTKRIERCRGTPFLEKKSTAGSKRKAMIPAMASGSNMVDSWEMANPIPHVIKPRRVIERQTANIVAENHNALP